MKRIKIYCLAFLMLMGFSGCGDSEIVGNYICNVGDDIDRDEIEINIQENSKVTFKHKNKIIKGKWDKDTNNINVYLTINGHSEEISLIKTGKFNSNLEVYTISSEGKTMQDACLKLKKDSFDDIKEYEYITKKAYVNTIKETEEYLSRLKMDVSSIKSSIITTRQENILKGQDIGYMKNLSTDNINLFDKVLMYPIKAGKTKGKWERNANDYDYHLTKNKVISFMYDSKNGTFECFYNCEYLN